MIMLVHKRIIVTITVLGLMSLLCLGGIVWTAFSIHDLKASISTIQTDIETRNALRQHARSAATELSVAGERLRQLPNVYLKEGDELDFVNALENAASANGVEQQMSLETVNQKQLSPWDIDIPLNIVVTGDYLDIMSYLGDIERLSYDLNVVFLEITLAQGRKSNSTDGYVMARLSGSVRLTKSDHPAMNISSNQTLEAASADTEAAENGSPSEN